MKRILPLFLIVSFASIALLGSVLFDMAPGHMGGCIASSIDGTTCPTNVADFGMHHISALETFTRTITPDASNWLLAFALVLLASAAVFIFLKNIIVPELQFLPQRFRELELDSLYNHQKITSWLSLFELSPAII